jgi:hypothetical protein
MNLPESRQKLNQKISTLTQEQIDILWQFIETLESQTSLSQGQTVLERMGGYPKFLLSEREDFSEREVRRQILSERIQQRQGERTQ